MATSRVRGRLARLEGRLGEAAIRWQARQATRDGAVPIAEYEAELRRFYRLVAMRLGPRPDHRALAALIAEQYGADEATVERELRAARMKRRTG